MAVGQKWNAFKDAGKEGRASSGLGHLEGLRNNTNPKWWRDPALRKLHVMLMAIAVCQITNGYDGSLINNLQALESWKKDLGNPDASMIGVFGVVQTVGSVVAAFWAAAIADRLGRRYGIFFGGLMVLAAGLMQGLAKNQATYIVGRMFAGAGNVTSIVSAASLNNELAHPRTRPYIAGYYNTIWYIGAIIAAWMCYGLRIHMPGSSWQWRIPSIFISAWGVFMVVLSLTVPESPRWLIANGRDEEAAKILYKWHANGDVEDELVNAEIMEIRHQINFDAHGKQIQKTWKQCFQTPGDRWRMGICIGFATIIGWTGQSIVSYYNTQILTTAGITEVLPQLGINGGLTIFDFFTAVLGAFLSGRMGRRPLFLASYIGMASAHVVVTGLSAKFAMTQKIGFGYAVIAFIWVESGFYNIACNPLAYAYIAEVLSVSTRAKGLALNLFTQEWQAIINRYCNPVGLANLGWKYYIIFLVFYIFEIAFIYFYFPETKGRTLEEIAEIFDGPSANTHAAAQIEHGRTEAIVLGAGENEKDLGSDEKQ